MDNFFSYYGFYHKWVVMRKFVSYIPPTAVVKLLQYSGLGSNTRMGFHPTNDSYHV